MNIFFVHRDPVQAAQMLCDKHVVKMTLETAQILSTVCGGPYRPTHENHPSVVWARDNLPWVFAHFNALLAEYTHRYGKTHKSANILPELKLFINPKDSTAASYPPPQCMPEECRGDDPVEAYRRYYMTEKASFARWERGRPSPSWFKPLQQPSCAS